MNIPYSHCPDGNIALRDFYKALLDKFPLGTILKSLARLSQTSALPDIGDKLVSSRVLLGKILQDPQLGIKNYISWTTKLSEFKEKNGLMNLYSKVGGKQGFCDLNKRVFVLFFLTQDQTFHC